GTVSGRKTATTIAQPSSAYPTWTVTAAWFIRSRSAVMTSEMGLRRTTVWSQSGNVSTGTNALDTNVSGSITTSEGDETDGALFAMVPMYMNTHARDQPVIMARRTPATTPGTPPPGREPMRMPIVRLRLAASA